VLEVVFEVAASDVVLKRAERVGGCFALEVRDSVFALILDMFNRVVIGCVGW
jgi:hypothetical protein